MGIRTVEDWQALIQRHQASGLSMKAFCVQEGIGYDWFCLKRKRILQDTRQTKAATQNSRFIRTQLSGQGGIEIRCGEVVCRLPAQTPVEYVAELLKAL